MKPQQSNHQPPSRREQRSLPRLRNFFNVRQAHQRRRIGSVIALLLACAGASVVMSN